MVVIGIGSVLCHLKCAIKNAPKWVSILSENLLSACAKHALHVRKSGAVCLWGVFVHPLLPGLAALKRELHMGAVVFQSTRCMVTSIILLNTAGDALQMLLASPCLEWLAGIVLVVTHTPG